MRKLWFDRNMEFGYPVEMLPYFLERLGGTFIRLQAKVKGVPDKILTEQHQGKWSVKQIIGHLAEVDQVANKRLDEITSGVATLSPAVFEPRDYNPMPMERMLAYFNTHRTANLAKYRTLSDEQLLKSSIHPRLKVPMTPVDLAWFDAEHDDHHMVKINEIIFTLTKK